jgi:uracil phosphoribosyltransferase
MPFYEFTNKKAVQILANQTRRTDITPFALSQSHIDLGKFLAYQICEEINLEECEIAHPQGKKKGVQIAHPQEIIILAFMRAGVYIGESLRTIFQKSPIFHVYPKRDKGLSEKELEELLPIQGKIIILADSVINTGKTIFPSIDQLQQYNPAKIIVTSLVMPDTTAIKIEEMYPNVYFYIARVSTNKYVGKGKTDTGNRLFGTLE